MNSNQEILHEIVDLPSKGLVYSENSPLSQGFVKIKYPTAKEEDILTNINYIRQGTVFDKLLEAVLLDKINIKELLTSDRESILVAIRVLAYGNEYKVNINNTWLNIDLSKVTERKLDDKLLLTPKTNEFKFTLPSSKTDITFKLPTVNDEEEIEKEVEGINKIKTNTSPYITTRLKHLILSVGGKRDQQTIRDFVDNMLSRDSKALRKYIGEISPSTEITYEYDFGNGLEKGSVPITPEFFWPE